jgi:hypothetical protein
MQVGETWAGVGGEEKNVPKKKGKLTWVKERKKETMN